MHREPEQKCQNAWDDAPGGPNASDLRRAATATLSAVGYEAGPVRYAKNRDIHVAYRVIGDEAIDLIHIAGAITHLNLDWEEPSYRRFSERLAGFARLLTFDKLRRF
jgi:hypothetical protein